jgi:hypothetical protein
MPKRVFKKNHSIKVPKDMQDIYQKIIDMTDDYCDKFLNDEYKTMVHYATAALCRKKLSPLVSGKLNTWACAIIYAIGFANFLFDKSFKPFVTAGELASAFGISKSTAGNKSKQVRDLLKINQLDHHWCLPSMLENSPSAWMISFDGFIVDARTMPKEVQEIAFEKGLIPHIPDTPGDDCQELVELF